MRAAVCQGLKRPLLIERVPEPAPGPGEVLLAVQRCGICGSDLHMSEEPAFGIKAGDVLGHEFAGEVVELGAGVDHLRKGDRVAVVPIRSCGACASCAAGEPAWCAQMALEGGGYAEFARTRAAQCVVLPRTASAADGAIVEPLAVALHGIALSGLRAGDRVLVLGAGPIGLAVAFWARRHGAARVVVQDIHCHQEQRALQMGATAFVADRDEPVAAAERALGGKADIVFECVGLPGLIAQAIDCTRIKGTVLILGLCTHADSFVPFAALSKELRLQTSAFFRRPEFETALNALDAGAVEPRLLVTETVALDAVPAVFEALKQRTQQCKVLIDPCGSA